MAASNVEPEQEWSDRALDTAEDTLVAMETLLATLRAFEDVLRQQETSTASSTEYCDNFCQALIHYAGSRNSMEHGLPLLEVYCLSINCFAAARSHLTAESDKVALVLKRLALSCFELLLSVPENEIPYEAWVQFHHSVQNAHDTLLRYGSTDLQALLQITGEGGAWSNPVLNSLLSGQLTNPEEVDAYITLEGEGFMEMRVKHLEKMGEVAKAVVLAKACTECSFISNQATFRQTYVSLLCHLLPSEEAIMEISRLDCKDVLEITCNLETEGEENTAFILCTTFLTQQLQQQSHYCSWELTQLWSKLQKRIDPSLLSLLERCLQLGAIAKTVHHLLYLVRVIQAEAEDVGVPASVELCVKALQLPKQKDSDTRISVCKTMSCLLPDDLEVLRACQLTEFLLGPSQEVFSCLEELHLRPDQKFDQENEVIPNSLRCELLLALKAYWPFDPEFWDWKTLKYHCVSLLGIIPESEGEEDELVDKHEQFKQEPQEVAVKVETEHQWRSNGSLDGHERQDTKPVSNLEAQGESEAKKRKFCCKICKRSVTETQLVHHSIRHTEDNSHPCPVCLERFESRKELVPHMKQHILSETHLNNNNVKKEDKEKPVEEDDDIEPGEITIDPSLMLYYKSTHDPDVLEHIVQQAKTVKEKYVDDDEHVTFDYIDQHFKLQNRDEYPCPGTGCTRIFKHSKYLYVHLKSEHKGDENVKYFHQMKDKREKCVFCRRHFVSAYHHRKHRRVHYGELPYMCVVIGCGAQFRTSNELVTHKQTHGFQLNFQCELKGCYVTCSDLGQIYHHEAQHFRDAAFTCSSAECSNYYLSKKEFIKHLSTHNITFSEDDFEAQRKAKRKLFKTVSEPLVRLNKLLDSEEIVSGDILSSPSVSCASPLQESDHKESKPTMTLVAVCFDGSKFTCGFEKCGMTFSRARDVQRHLKCAHPEHLKLENKEYKHEKEQGSKSKGARAETDPDDEEKGNHELSTPFQPVEDGKERNHPKNNETNSSSLQINNDALKEILIGLSKLNLNSSSPQSVSGESTQTDPESNTSQMSLHQAIMAKPPVVLLQKRPPHLPEEKVKIKTEQTSIANEEGGIESLANAKPYICQIEYCDFRTAQSYSLQRHYNTKHGRTVEQARTLTSLKTTCFKPYVCHLCSKSHRQKSVLRAHYLQIHKISSAQVDKVSCGSVSEKQVTNRGLKVKKKEKLQLQPGKKTSTATSENGKKIDNHSPSEEEGEDEADSREEETEEKNTKQVRSTRRLVSKSNLCYILDKFSKPFHCVAKNCDAAFSTQGGLVRHLQLVHHYNRSQLLLEKDFDVHHSPEVKKEPAKKRPPPNSDEPQPQYKCHFANCRASYHLKSSLVRHTRDCHSQPPELIKCKFEGCTKVFCNNEALKKHTLYSHCEYYDSLVVRLQSTHKKSVTGCQKKLIVTPQSSEKEAPGSPTAQASSPESEVTTKSEEVAEQSLEERKTSGEKKKEGTKPLVYRSYEEALQMCQDRCMREAYPCMVQNCDSVVTYVKSLHRHYLRVHRMGREHLVKNQDKLVFNAEKLEALIQRKSARPTVKIECKAEAENTGGQAATMSLLSIKEETLDEDNHHPLGIPEDEEEEEVLPPVERNGVLVVADEVLYGEPSTGGHTEDSAAAAHIIPKQDERLSWDKIKPLLRPVTVDLSPPCSLRFTTEESFQDALSNKDGGKMVNGSATAATFAVRQPLKRKNELSEQPSNVIDPQPRSPSPRPFDIAAYKPIGFESSFLKFIQDSSPKDKNPGAVKRRDAFRRSCSVKENNQLGISHTRSRRTHSPLLKPHAMTGDFTSVQNLKSILDKALAGCGDLAIKQLQYLRPVVVLGRPVCTTTLPDLFPSDPNNSKLLLGS
nr:PREDICTED: zinc finger protein Rlf [Paralichthys olivaceus]